VNELIISNTSIRQDEHGRYCLNDLHKASGGADKHTPGLWLANKSTQALIAEINSSNSSSLETIGIPIVYAVEGRGGGTYVCKELVYAYTMWISPSFHLQVIRAYNAMVTQPTQQQGKSVSNVIEQAQVLESTAKAFQALHGVAKLVGCDDNASAISANNMIVQATGVNILAGFGKTHLTAENQDTLWYTPTQLGAMLPIKTTAREVNKRLENAGLQTKNGEVWEATETAIGLYRLFDTAKRHSSGVPITQMKWAHQVLEKL
jgi:hypothetical protein